MCRTVRLPLLAIASRRSQGPGGRRPDRGHSLDLAEPHCPLFFSRLESVKEDRGVKGQGHVQEVTEGVPKVCTGRTHGTEPWRWRLTRREGRGKARPLARIMSDSNKRGPLPAPRALALALLPCSPHCHGVRKRLDTSTLWVPGVPCAPVRHLVVWEGAPGEKR